MKKAESEKLTIRISPRQGEALEQLSRQSKRTKSELVRKFIDKGLSIDNFEQDEAKMLLAIRQAVALELEQPIERIAAIGAKGSQISSAAFFMLIHTIRLMTVEEERSGVDELAAKSRRLGIEYLKAKNESIDAFIENSLKRL